MAALGTIVKPEVQKLRSAAAELHFQAATLGRYAALQKLRRNDT